MIFIALISLLVLLGLLYLIVVHKQAKLRAEADVKSGNDFEGRHSHEASEYTEAMQKADAKGELRPGKLINNKYLVLDKLGKGGMGQVYLCKSLSVGNLWAVKYIPFSSYNERCNSIEESILKKLNHIYLPKIVDVFYEQGGVYIVESYIEGVPLDKLMEKEGAFDEETVVEWGRQLCEALKYLHNLKPNPVIYRDMKPSNVIISNANVAILIDFGISKEYRGDEEGQPDPLLAFTSRYAAPEQLLGFSDQRSDIYSLGGMLLYLLTANDVSELKNNSYPLEKISKGLQKVLLKAVEAEAKNRYSTIDELYEALTSIKAAPLKINRANALPKDYRKIIGIFSPFAIGKTTIACNLASAYAKHGISVALIDTDDIKKGVQYHFNIDPLESLNNISSLDKAIRGGRQINKITDYCIGFKSLEIYTDHRDSRYGFGFEILDTILKYTGQNVILIDISSSLQAGLINKILSTCNERLLIIDKAFSNLMSLPASLNFLEGCNYRNMSVVLNRDMKTKGFKEKEVIEFLSSVEVFGSQKAIGGFKHVFSVPERYKELIEAMLKEPPSVLYGKDREFDLAIERLAFTIYPAGGRYGSTGLVGRIRDMIFKQ